MCLDQSSLLSQPRSDSNTSNDSIDYDTCPINSPDEIYPVDQSDTPAGDPLDQLDTPAVDLGVAEGFQCSSAEKQRTRLREEGNIGSDETDALKILGLVC